MHYEEMLDDYSTNEDLYHLYDKKDTVIYKEIVLFLNDFNPDWRKNKELGRYAAELIIDTIEELENSFESDGEEENTETESTNFKNWLAMIYDNIAQKYNRLKSYNEGIRKTAQLNAYHEVWESEEGYNKMEFQSDEYNRLFARFLQVNNDNDGVYVFF